MFPVILLKCAIIPKCNKCVLIKVIYSDNKTKSDIEYNPKTRVSIRSLDAIQ